MPTGTLWKGRASVKLHDMSRKAFWLYGWFDQLGVHDEQSLETALDRGTAYDELIARASDASSEAGEIASSRYATVAGRGLDFSGAVDCSSQSCRQRQIDMLFKRVWHYFDRIILADAVGHELRQHHDDGPEHAFDLLRKSAPALLYLREIGAEELIEFRDKPCSFNDWKEQEGLGYLFNNRSQLVSQIADEATIKMRTWVERVYYEFEHPDFTVIESGDFDYPGFSTNKNLRLTVADIALRNQMEWLVGDVISSKNLRAPLTVGIEIHGRLLRQAGRPLAPDDVALSMHLPVLDNIPTVELIRFRKAERESFERFRKALTEAIAARLALTDTSLPRVAAEIYNDLISPELLRISEKLRIAGAALAKKAAFGVSLGAATVACGVFTGLVPLMATGVAAILSSAVVAENKYVDDRREVSLDDMYFIWKAAHLHGSI